jgi:chromatin structure-remodeling complex subunit RSC3/30
VTAFHTDGYNLPLEGTSYLERPLASYNLIGPSRSQIEQGAHVLLLLEHLSLFRGILESPFQVWDAILVGPPFVRQLWETFEELFESSIRHASDKAAAALQLSEQFFENTSKPITTSPSMAFTEYVSQIARRWESVGIFFCRTGLVCTFIPGDDSVFRQEGSPIGDKKGYYALTVKVSTLCLQFCDTFDLVSDPLCWLAFQSNLLLSQTHGMSGQFISPSQPSYSNNIVDHRTWQRLGDLTTILFALGYHQLEPDSNVPFFLAELRKRAMVAAYSFDKKVAIFLGRPPRICERYCTLIPPLALKYEEMVAASEERDRALAKLDKHGLTTEGLLSGNASAQLRLMLSIQKENILELSLSPRTDNLIEKVDTLIGESNKLRAMLPLPGLLLDDQHKTTLDVSPESIHLEVMYLELLLYRTLVNRTGARLDALIQTALKILDMLHILVAKQARNRKGTLGLGIQVSQSEKYLIKVIF